MHGWQRFFVTLMVVVLAARTFRMDVIPLVKECEALALFEALSWALRLDFYMVIFE